MANIMNDNFNKMYNLIVSYSKPCLIACAAKYDIVDHLLKKQMNCKELSVATKTNEAGLKRILSGLVSIGVLEEAEDEKYSATKFGETLKNDEKSLKHLAMLIDLPYTACNYLWYLVETGETPFVKAFGKNFYDYIKHDSEKRDIFNRSFMELSNICYSSCSNVYDFSVFRRIVDIGGANGAFLRCILSSNKDANGVLFELPSVIQISHQSLKDEFGGRIETIEGDYIHSVPADGDLYILKYILHNCDDDKAVKVLGNIRGKMKANAKILIIESFKGHEYSIGIDIIMMALLNGKCRSVEEYKRLIQDANLRYNRLISMPDCFNDIIEVIL